MSDNAVVKITTRSDVTGLKQSQIEVDKLKASFDKLTKSAEEAASASDHLKGRNLTAPEPVGRVIQPSRYIAPPPGPRHMAPGLATISNREQLKPVRGPSSPWSPAISAAAKRGYALEEQRLKQAPVPVMAPVAGPGAGMGIGGFAKAGAAGFVAAGVGLLIGKAIQGVLQDAEEAKMRSDLGKRMGTGRVDSREMKEALKGAADAATLKTDEVLDAAASWTQLAGAMEGVEGVAKGIAASGGFARALGLDVQQTVTQFASLSRIGAFSRTPEPAIEFGPNQMTIIGGKAPLDEKEFAGLLAEAVSSGNMYGRESELLSGVNELVSLQAKATLQPSQTGIKDTLAMMTAMNSSDLAGLKGSAGTNLLAKLNAGFQNPGGGAYGTSLMYKYLGEGMDPFQFQMRLEEGAFGPSRNFETVMPNFLKDTQSMSESVRYALMSKMFGVSMHEAKGLMSSYQTMGSSQFGNMYSSLQGILGPEELKTDRIGVYAKLFKARGQGAGKEQFAEILKDPGLKLDDKQRAEIAAKSFDDMIRSVNKAKSTMDYGETVREAQKALSDGFKELGAATEQLTKGFSVLVDKIPNVGDWKGTEAYKQQRAADEMKQKIRNARESGNPWLKFLYPDFGPNETKKTWAMPKPGGEKESVFSAPKADKKSWVSPSEAEAAVIPSGKVTAQALHAIEPKASLDVSQHIINESERLGLDPVKSFALVRQESNFDRYALSPKGAMGYTQLMPGTAKDMGVNDPYDPFQNISGGLRYYAELKKRYGSDEAAMAAYNMGPGNFEKKRCFGETDDYIKAIPKHEQRYRQLLEELPVPKPERQASSDKQAQNPGPQASLNQSWNIYLDGSLIHQASGFNQGRGNSTRNSQVFVG